MDCCRASVNPTKVIGEAEIRGRLRIAFFRGIVCSKKVNVGGTAVRGLAEFEFMLPPIALRGLLE